MSLIAVSAMGLACCGGDYDNFVEPTEYRTKPSFISNIRSVAQPGQITLQWDTPADNNYYFLQVKYYDHLTKQEKAQVASVYTNSITIPDTRAKYGEYEFSFQTFNSKYEGSKVETFKAVSGIAPAITTYTPTKVALTVSQLSSNAAEPTEGPIANLLDGNANTFFHTRWSGGGQPWPHYLQVKLNEPLKDFQFYYKNRNGSECAPTDADIMVSTDGENWTTLKKLTSELPTGSGADYYSEVFRSPAEFTYFRFNVNAAVRGTGTQSSFNMAEFAMYSVKIDVFDPESPDED